MYPVEAVQYNTIQYNTIHKKHTDHSALFTVHCSLYTAYLQINRNLVEMRTVKNKMQ